MCTVYFASKLCNRQRQMHAPHTHINRAFASEQRHIKVMKIIFIAKSFFCLSRFVSCRGGVFVVLFLRKKCSFRFFTCLSWSISLLSCFPVRYFIIPQMIFLRLFFFHFCSIRFVFLLLLISCIIWEISNRKMGNYSLPCLIFTYRQSFSFVLRVHKYIL